MRTEAGCEPAPCGKRRTPASGSQPVRSTSKSSTWQPSAWEQWLAAHVFAAAEQEGRLVGVGVALDVADEDDVVAAVMAILVAAFEMGGGADQHRGAAFGDDVVDLGELV